MLSAVVLSITLALCGIDHISPMNGTVDHSSVASHGCIPDLCVTAVSEDGPPLGKTSGIFLFFSLLWVSGITSCLSGIDAHHASLLIGADHPPKVSKKLYQIYAVYLL